ncbi:hypothetical protein DAPK24_000180 [Pichia kluyveri]|uniref:Uncharacterized protein n=1 Tax=Pichia kluyveri TaxID=36015 RepID=A0AAV5QW27_PICKL|nr:hypothetical protein DAPK24_000180 [Pichia kluyveri]
MKISIISKKHGEEMIASEKDYNLYVNTLFFDRFLNISPLLYQIRDGKNYLPPLKRLMERSEMFNFEITDDVKCDKTTIFGLNDHGFLDYISAKYSQIKHNKVSCLKLPVDESNDDNESFNSMNKVEKTPENIKSIGDSMKELKDSFEASMEVFKITNANLFKEYISKIEHLEKTLKSNNKKGQQTMESNLDGNVTGPKDPSENSNTETVIYSTKVDTVTNTSDKPETENALIVADFTSSTSFNVPTNDLTESPSSTPINAPKSPGTASSTQVNVSTKAPSSNESNTPINAPTHGSTNVSTNVSSSTLSSTSSFPLSNVNRTNVSTKVLSISPLSASLSGTSFGISSGILSGTLSSTPSNSKSGIQSTTTTNF